MKSSKKINNLQWKTILSYLLTDLPHVRDLEIIEGRHTMLNLFPKNSVCAEIGVAKGDFSKKMLQITYPSKLHLVDIWGGKMWPYIEDKFQEEVTSGTVVLHRQTSEEASEVFPERCFDWIYIDANHTYKFIHSDLEKYKSKMKKGGIIAGHDYFITEPKKKPPFGVVQAVNEFCYKYNWRMTHLVLEKWNSVTDQYICSYMLKDNSERN